MRGPVTKVVRVHLAGGLAVDVLIPTGTVVVLDAVVRRALDVARRLFQLEGEPLITGIDASQSLPGDVFLNHHSRSPQVPKNHRAKLGGSENHRAKLGAPRWR